MCDVEWRVVDCGVLDVECYRMQDVESYIMRNVVWNCGEGCGIFNVLCDCCVISDVENDALCCDVRCGVMQNYQDVVV